MGHKCFISYKKEDQAYRHAPLLCGGGVLEGGSPPAV